MADLASTIVAAVSGLVGAGVGGFASYKVAQQHARVLRDGQAIAQEGLVTERYTKAVDQLGGESANTRIGGVHALLRIAKDSPSDRESIFEVIAAFVRAQSPRAVTSGEQVAALRVRAADVQIALDILFNWRWPQRPTLDLTGSHLGVADLRGADLSRAVLFGVDLAGADLSGAELTETNLNEANLTGAYLTEANLTGTYLTDANLSEATLLATRLPGANLSRANLSRASLHGADLTGALLPEADLTDARLIGADLAGANLTVTKLIRTDLTRAKLTGANLFMADFTGAWLDEADLSEADLTMTEGTDAVHLTETNGALGSSSATPATSAPRRARRGGRFTRSQSTTPRSKH